MTLRSRMFVLLAAVFALLVGGCGSQSEPAAEESPSATSSAVAQSSAAPAPDTQFCAHNRDSKCPAGSYVGPFVAVKSGGGTWGADGRPLNGGPAGADGSTGNNLTHEYCAKNQDPACPAGTFVAPDAIKNPDGSNGYSPCEGTICTNPNHGAGDQPDAVDPPTGDAPDIGDAPPADDSDGVDDGSGEDTP